MPRPTFGVRSGRLTVPLAALALTLSTAPVARAQDDGLAVEINPYVGAIVFDDEDLGQIGLEVDAGALIGGRVVVPLAPEWWAEAAYGFAPLTIEPSEFGDEEVEPQRDLGVHLYYGGIGYLIGSDQAPTRLVLSAGAGGMTLQPEAQDASTNFMASLGLGFTHPVNDWITFRGDVRDHVLFCRADDDPEDFEACLDDEALNNFEISGGLLFRLRG